MSQGYAPSWAAAEGAGWPRRCARPAPLAWNPDLATGHAQIDEQHQRIFQIFNGLIEATAEAQEVQAGKALASIALVVGTHFRQEEDLMARAGYPGLTAHREAHRELGAQVDLLVDQFHDQGLDPLDLLHLMALWLEGHVRDQDQPMAGFLRATDGAGPA